MIKSNAAVPTTIHSKPYTNLRKKLSSFYSANHAPSTTHIPILNPITRLVPDPYNPNALAADDDPLLPVLVPIAPPVPVGVSPLGI